MSRLCKVVAALFGVAAGAFLLPAMAQTPVPAKFVTFLEEEAQPDKRNNDTDRASDGAAIIRMLAVPIETKGLQEKVKLKEALELFSDMFQGNLSIIVDLNAFSAQIRNPDVPDVYETEVSLPPVPKRMPMSTALELILSQVGNEDVRATFLIRRGYVEIVPVSLATAKHLLTRKVFARAVENPLDFVLRDLSEQTGLTINLDPAIGKKAAASINANFRNVALEDALVTVTEMAELKFVVLRDSVFVTLPGKVEAIQKEEKQREERRQPAKVKAAPAK